MAGINSRREGDMGPTPLRNMILAKKGHIVDNNPSSPPQATQQETASFVVAVIALCFAALGAGWSFIGGVCCGWAGWGWAFIGFVLSIVSLALKRSAIGWVALSLGIFAFAWVFISGFMLGAGTVGAGTAVLRGAAGSARNMQQMQRPPTRRRQGTSGAYGGNGIRSGQ